MTGTDVVLAPALQTQVQELVDQAITLRAAAERLQIRNDMEARLATEFLARAKQARDASEQARKAAVSPLNAEVKAINDAFKGDAQKLLEEADRLVRDRLVVYTEEAERRRRAEQERLEAERREREAAAAAERQRLQAEADQRARDAAEAERERLAAMADADRQRADELDELTDDALNMIVLEDAATGGDQGPSRDARLAQQVLDARVARRAEEARAAEAQAAADAAQVAELQARTEQLPDVAAGGPLRSRSGAASTSKRWVFEVTDPDQVPRDYLAVDETVIRQAVRDGVRDIPGVRIFQATSVAVRTTGSAS